MRTSLRALVILSTIFAAAAHAQSAGTVTLTANRTSASGSFTPTLTWSTSPVASSCTASGGWSGTKFASGSETVATISASKSYTLTCYWNNGSAVVNWNAPTTNTDTTPLTDLAGFKILYGTSSSALNQSVTVNNPAARSATVDRLAGGTWYFAVRAVNSANVESPNSNLATKVIGTAKAAKTVSITISSGTTTKTLKTTGTVVYDVVIRNGARALGRQVGTIALDKTCQQHYQVGTSYFMVAKTDARITITPRSNAVVAQCALK